MHNVRVEFEYLNLEWQEALFTEVFDDPRNRMSFVVSNKQLPCNEEYIFVAKAYGVNGECIHVQWHSSVLLLEASTVNRPS